MRTRILFILCIVMAGLAAFSCQDSDGTTTDGLSGKGGSTARFAVTATHLFAVEDDALKVYQIMGNGALEKINAIQLNPGVETIFTRDHWLYLGTVDAMITYDIATPANPLFVSSYSHVVSCDPVVVQDTLAFVTLRTFSCRPSNTNQLEIINIKNPQQPVRLSSYGLNSPYGLGVDGDLLFVCEGESGLTVLNVKDPMNIHLIKRYDEDDAYDVIPHDGTLILTGKDGVAQYDYTDPDAIKKLSLIPVAP
ncbi:LVIVD repeat-containing protein [Chryseolinea soli]|uniref:LVIVD repeat-containing protein n=1 Tax=Chryseolinea soli TaxID=2321403 RepID=A0A385SYY2_9BACT|nr:hypothetical protein [Chryseolinea soli]AYB33958.1 hypothetical protein D4L85_26760 [Chryseolinea soli]